MMTNQPTIIRDFTKEQLIEHAQRHIAHHMWLKEKFGEDCKNSATVALAIIALTSLDDSAHLDNGQMSSSLWLEAPSQSADLQTRALVMWIKRLSLALRYASPDNKLPKAAMSYLQNNGLVSIADCLRGNNEEPPA